MAELTKGATRVTKVSIIPKRDWVPLGILLPPILNPRIGKEGTRIF